MSGVRLTPALSGARSNVARYFLAGVCLLGLLSEGCLRGCESDDPPIHIVPNMDWQEKYQPLEASEFFYDGKAMRHPVPGTVARGELPENPVVVTGKNPDGSLVEKNPLDINEKVLARGEERYDIYCAPCHDRYGEGQGILTQRGNVPVPSYHIQRLREASDGHYFDVITHGKGLMSSYRYPVPPRDRWAIVAHIRELQKEHQRLAATGASP